jgi:hypothetical protein
MNLFLRRVQHGAAPVIALVAALAAAAPWRHARADAAPPDGQAYASQCGACHVPFPPGDLPARSWRAIMGGLDRHFGEDASLDAAAAGAILRYLLYYAGGTEHGGTTELMLDLPDSQTPRRIVDLPAWRIHHAYLVQSGQVTLGPGPHSAANCLQCHGPFALP